MTLPGATTVLDLACGRGAVLRALQKGNSGLDLTGVDLAELPQSGKGRFRLIGKTDLASLPFENGRFGAVTSQFGIEYSDIESSAREILRVSAPQAALFFVTHHRDSPIVAKNRARLAALDAIAQSAIFKNAGQLAAQSGGSLAMIRQAFQFIAQAHLRQPVVTEIAGGIEDALKKRSRQALKRLAEIEENLSLERGILRALESVALDSGGVAGMMERFDDSVTWRDPVPLVEPTIAAPLAWIISGQRQETGEG
jgi:ubiquinone/menaquinone biosynthesis C-methylase UbiE